MLWKTLNPYISVTSVCLTKMTTLRNPYFIFRVHISVSYVCAHLFPWHPAYSKVGRTFGNRGNSPRCQIILSLRQEILHLAEFSLWHLWNWKCREVLWQTCMLALHVPVNFVTPVHAGVPKDYKKKKKKLEKKVILLNLWFWPHIQIHSSVLVSSGESNSSHKLHTFCNIYMYHMCVCMYMDKSQKLSIYLASYMNYIH